jgi:hypothetical protein
MNEKTIEERIFDAILQHMPDDPVMMSADLLDTAKSLGLLPEDKTHITPEMIMNTRVEDDDEDDGDLSGTLRNGRSYYNIELVLTLTYNDGSILEGIEYILREECFRLVYHNAKLRKSDAAGMTVEYNASLYLPNNDGASVFKRIKILCFDKKVTIDQMAYSWSDEPEGDETSAAAQQSPDEDDSDDDCGNVWTPQDEYSADDPCLYLRLDVKQDQKDDAFFDALNQILWQECRVADPIRTITQEVKDFPGYAATITATLLFPSRNVSDIVRRIANLCVNTGTTIANINWRSSGYYGADGFKPLEFCDFTAADCEALLPKAALANVTTVADRDPNSLALRTTAKK